MHNRLAEAAASFDHNVAAYKSMRLQTWRQEIDRLTATSLKALAQTLIALESAHHAYARDVPSVGGGIDLMVMRRGDRNVPIDHCAAA